jgi:putative transposase
MSTPSPSWHASEVARGYPSNVDDATWKLIAPLPAQANGRGRRRTHPDRVAYDAILSVLNGGIQWRMRPDSFPPGQTVYGCFRR